MQESVHHLGVCIRTAGEFLFHGFELRFGRKLITFFVITDSLSKIRVILRLQYEATSEGDVRTDRDGVIDDSNRSIGSIEDPITLGIPPALIFHFPSLICLDCFF